MQSFYEHDFTNQKLFSFPYINYNFDSAEEGDAYLDDQTYRHVALTKVVYDYSNDRYFGVTPRFFSDVPATVSLIDQDADGFLTPFPDWTTHTSSTTTSLISVSDIYVGTDGDVWILDSGRADLDSTPCSKCAKIVRYSSDGVRKDLFTLDSSISLNSYLTSFAIDEEKSIVYVADANIDIDSKMSYNPAIIVADLQARLSWRRLEDRFEVLPDLSVVFDICGQDVFPNSPLNIGIASIAFSRSLDSVFFSPLTSHAVYSVAASLLNDSDSRDSVIYSSLSTVIDGSGADGNIPSGMGSASLGIAVSNDDRLFVSAIEHNALLAFSLDTYTTNTITIDSTVSKYPLSGFIMHDHTELCDANDFIFPSFPSLANNGAAIVVASRLHEILDSDYNDLLPWTEQDDLFNVWRIGSADAVDASIPSDGSVPVPFTSTVVPWFHSMAFAVILSIVLTVLVMLLVYAIVKKCTQKQQRGGQSQSEEDIEKDEGKGSKRYQVQVSDGEDDGKSRKGKKVGENTPLI
eukprot:gnl/Carplike_NY0171/5914_a8097_199.p1 GENE.gnl/Carplike_NY0171/5914_a8097_199~~gnl/Carplike_NY0171/5914_a8097_199.p1  ORF type:complete len:519 (-),score=141.31 gnl/Carplike_NY0171/5914_a8097_199:140-1696(-)